MECTPAFCGRCGIPLAEGKPHETSQECIKILRTALQRQSKAAERLAFEVSTRLLAVLEELSIRPDTPGIPYFRFVDGEKLRVESDRVSGIFTAILKQYKELGDWSPMQEQREQMEVIRDIGYNLYITLNELLKVADDHLCYPKGMREKIEDALLKACPVVTRSSPSRS